jgi:hypothetical protein
MNPGIQLFGPGVVFLDQVGYRRRIWKNSEYSLIQYALWIQAKRREKITIAAVITKTRILAIRIRMITLLRRGQTFPGDSRQSPPRQRASLFRWRSSWVGVRIEIPPRYSVPLQVGGVL